MQFNLSEVPMNKWTVLTAVLLAVIGAPAWPCFAADETKDPVHEELKAQIDDVRDWVTHRADEWKSGQDEARGHAAGLREWVNERIETARRELAGSNVHSIGRNITLEFAITGQPQRHLVTTATSQYRLSGSFKNEDRKPEGESAQDAVLDVFGSISLDETAGNVLVTCEGAFGMTQESGQADSGQTGTQVLLNFDASALFKSGETRVLAVEGDTEFSLKVTIE